MEAKSIADEVHLTGSDNFARARKCGYHRNIECIFCIRLNHANGINPSAYSGFLNDAVSIQVVYTCQSLVTANGTGPA